MVQFNTITATFTGTVFMSQNKILSVRWLNTQGPKTGSKHTLSSSVFGHLTSTHPDLLPL